MIKILIYSTFVVACLTIIYRLVRCVLDILYFRSLPGPNVDFLLRHEISFTESGDKLSEFAMKYQRIYPRLCRYFIGPFPFITISHPEVVKHIITNLKLQKHYMYRTMLGSWIGDGLLLSKGNKWHRHRKIITPAFHYSILSSVLSVYREATTVMLHLWEETALKDGFVTVQDFTPYLSLDILLQSIGSLKTNCQVERDAVQYVKDVNFLTETSVLRFFNFMYMIDAYFYLTPTGRAYQACCRRAQAYTRDLILKRKRILTMQRQSPGAEMESRDFLDILLTSTDEKGVGLTDGEICDEVDTFVFEGHDTTSSAMTWLLYYLALYPEYQEMCREEVNRYFNSKRLAMKDLSNLEFLTMFIKETLRLKPPVYSVVRVNAQTIHLDGYRIPKNTLIEISIRQIHLNSEFWPNPLKFDPWRFSKDNLVKMDPYSYLPFSAGERNCIGQIFAMNELRVVSSMILQKFKLQLHPCLIGEKIVEKLDLLTKPLTPMKFILTKCS